jgi:hypothetical protein
MKEATGELNMTVVAVVAITAVGAFFYAFIWPQVKNTIKNSTYCANATCPSTCTTGETCKCTYLDTENKEQTVTCKIKND